MSSSWATLCLVSCFFTVSSTFLTIEVQHGANVTLQCTNSSTQVTHISWFHMSDQFNISRICSMIDPKGNVTFSSPARGGKYAMSSTISTLFLTVKKVVSSDGGLYFCGEKTNTEKTVIFTATYLKIQENVSWYSTNVPIFIMAGIISLLVLLVGGLLLKIHKLLKAAKHPSVERYKVVYGDSVHVFTPTTLRSRRTPQNPEETHVVYTAIRESA